MTSFGAKPKLRPIEEFTGPDFIKARGTTPLRYVGGKSQMLRLLGYHMPARIDEFRELFCGGASMAFLIAARYPGASIWINDLDEPLFRFWKSLQDPETSHEMIERLVEIRSKYVDTADLRKLFFEKQEMLRHGHGAAVDRAVALYFLSRCSFNGFNNSGSFSAYNAQDRFRMEHIHRLEEWTPRMAGWEITNLDYREVLKKPWTGESPFLFCDPPYDNKARLYGDRGDKHIEFDHQAFHRAVQATPRNVAVMVTYNAADKIRVEYDDWQQIGFDIEYSLRSDEQYRKNQKSRRDLLLLRY
jgi:DNA adenine methylase